MSKRESDLQTELLSVLAKHGVEGVPAIAKATPERFDPGLAGSYIKEIITDSQVFDERVLAQVTEVLRRGTEGR